MSKKAQSPVEPKGRWHFLETYHSQKVIESVLEEHQAHIVHFAYIYHNQDRYTEDSDKHKKGDLKEPHWHILLYLSNTRTVKTVQNWFDSHNTDEVANTRNPNLCGDAGIAFAYLTHELNPEKAQYNCSEIITDAYNWWNAIRITSIRDRNFPKQADSGLVQMYEDLINGLNTWEMVHKWGKAYIVNSVSLRGLVLDTLNDFSIECQIQETKQAKELLEKQVHILHERVEDLKGKYKLSCHKKFAELNSAIQERTLKK